MRRPTAASVVLPALLVALGAFPAGQEPVREPDVIFLPSPDPIVEAMLDLAGVTADDVVYDLGSGDGKIVIAAARRGARAVGVELDPDLVARAEASARAAGVADRARFVLGDIFDPNVPIGDATVVTLYLLETLNIQLMPRLRADLRPGSRVVSNTFRMGPTWPPERSIEVDRYPIHLWTIPAR